MFVDYYELLEIAENADSDEIKASFRKQAIKWHPDRNPQLDTTVKMQRINEAYLILKDPEAREKFDLEYKRFQGFKGVYKQEGKKSGWQNQHESHRHSSRAHEGQKTEYEGYAFNDEILNTWMSNARRQSVDLAKQTIRDFKGMVSVGFKEGAKASGNALIGQIVLSIIVLTILGLSKSCNA